MWCLRYDGEAVGVSPPTPAWRNEFKNKKWMFVLTLLPSTRRINFDNLLVLKNGWTVVKMGKDNGSVNGLVGVGTFFLILIALMPLFFRIMKVALFFFCF